jgi:NAD-dependent deacetylase
MFSQTLIDRLANARLVIAFTGAGISAESGVATFRATDGLWSKFRPEELANVDAFMANPQMVWEWYQARRDVVLDARPNAGHLAIAELEQLVPKVSVVTQNIDGLHAEAGSTEVIELHGNIRRNFCQNCRRRYDDAFFLTVAEVQSCECGGAIRPDVVWFGEMLPEGAFELAEKRARQANVLFTIGTSAVVYPAAGIPMLALQSGAYVVEINPEETPLTRYVHESIRAASGEVMPGIVERLWEVKHR